MSTATLAHGRHAARTVADTATDLMAELKVEAKAAARTAKQMFEDRFPRWDEGGEQFIRHTAARIHSHRRPNAVLTIAKVSIALAGVMLAAAL